MIISEPDAPTRRPTARIVVAVALVIALLVGGGLYVLLLAQGQGRGDIVAGSPLRKLSGADLLYVDSTPGATYGRLATVPLRDPSAAPQRSSVVCQRVYASGGRAICLRAKSDLTGGYEAVIMDYSFDVQRTVPVAGLPSRARISQDGRIASWTVFVSGDSYLSRGFSTRTSILDLSSGQLVGSLETFKVLKDGRPYQSPDINFWGVTIAADDNTFYATMATQGQTYLVRGDLRAHSVLTLRSNVECPSLSPDGTRIAFKKRVSDPTGRVPWRLYVLDLATMKETALSETRSADDQAAWLDNSTIAYALPESGISTYDLWTVASDGTGKPRLLRQLAVSPAAVGAG